MKVLRWLVFLPLAAVLIAIAQLLTGWIVGHSTWWIGLPVVFFFGVIVAGAGMIPVRMTSDPKIAAAVILTLFVLFEGIALAKSFGSFPVKELIGRILVDFQILVGALMGASPGGEQPDRTTGPERA